MTAKQELRKEVHANIRALSERDERDETIIHKVLSLPVWQQAHTVALTLSLDLEVNTRPLIDAALEAGKSVLVPKVTKQGLTFHEIKTFSELHPGVMGILEPTTMESDLDIDVCIVPGRVFDRSGYRIGWGGGYYDRFLATYDGATIAIAYGVQVLDEIPIEPHDIPVELIVTEREMIRCSQSSS